MSRETPTNAEGKFVCGRSCKDGSPCEAIVPLAGLSCYQHSRSAPVADRSFSSSAQ
ncbi:hypothetical protein [Halalkalicoccus ordinarius]|uniref:hypothetical protein n=1 Tax=Halalkalicoccus ordinarius TaxID=3116651 RepID=UPI00300F4D56